MHALLKEYMNRKLKALRDTLNGKLISNIWNQVEYEEDEKENEENWMKLNADADRQHWPRGHSDYAYKLWIVEVKTRSSLSAQLKA